MASCSLAHEGWFPAAGQAQRLLFPMAVGIPSRRCRLCPSPGYPSSPGSKRSLLSTAFGRATEQLGMGIGVCQPQGGA